MQTNEIRGVRIVSDGTMHGTKVVDANTGEAIQRVTKIDITHRAGMLPEAVIYVGSVKADLSINAVVLPPEQNASDCAQHNEPAMPAGSCDCGATVHPDDAAVDALAAAMKAKLAKQRAKGYGGWDTDCTQQRLSDMLRGHVDKGDPVDVANFCAFLLARGESIAAAPAGVDRPIAGPNYDKLVAQLRVDLAAPASDATIEAEIQAKGLTAPRVTLADLQANIVSKRIVVAVSESGQVMRWAVLTVRNGYAVTGRPSVSVSPENDNAEIGEKVAIDNAIQELWPLMGYALKERLAAPPSIQLTPAEVQSGVDRVRWAEGLIKQLPEDHDGRNSWLLNYGSDKAERQAEWARRNPQSALVKGTAAVGAAAGPAWDDLRSKVQHSAPDLRPAADNQPQ